LSTPLSTGVDNSVEKAPESRTLTSRGASGKCRPDRSRPYGVSHPAEPAALGENDRFAGDRPGPTPRFDRGCRARVPWHRPSSRPFSPAHEAGHHPVRPPPPPVRSAWALDRGRGRPPTPDS